MAGAASGRPAAPRRASAPRRPAPWPGRRAARACSGSPPCAGRHQPQPDQPAGPHRRRLRRPGRAPAAGAGRDDPDGRHATRWWRADVSWLPGEQSVEAVMLVEVGPDGRSARVESVPLPYDDRVGGSVARPASASVAAVESWSGRRVDHVMAIDWQTFASWPPTTTWTPPTATDRPASPSTTTSAWCWRAPSTPSCASSPSHLYRALRTTASGVAIDDDWSVAGARPPGAPPARPPLGRHQLRTPAG